MDDSRSRTQQYLALADRHIANIKNSIARQREFIHELVRGGHEIELAETTLVFLQITLAGFEQHRANILKRLKMPL
jgi:hypothetical protein